MGTLRYEDRRHLAAAWCRDLLDRHVPFIDPNDWGPRGYAVLSLLLMLFKRVCVHSPYSLELAHAREQLVGSDPSRGLVLNWSDIEQLVTEDDPLTGSPALIVTGFETYLGGGRPLHPDGSDGSRWNRGSDFARSVVLLPDKRDEHAQAAIEFASQSDIVAEVDKRLRQPESFSPRLLGRIRTADDRQIPAGFRGTWPDLSEAHRCGAVATYDLLNDGLAIDGGGSSIPCLTPDGFFAASLVNPLDLDWPGAVPYPQLSLPAFDRLVAALAEQLTPTLRRLSVKEIRSFRLHYRKDFADWAAEVLALASGADHPDGERAVINEQILRVRGSSERLYPTLVRLVVATEYVPGPVKDPARRFLLDLLPRLDPTRTDRWTYYALTKQR